MISAVIIGNEVTENRNGYALIYINVRDSQCLWKHKKNMTEGIAVGMIVYI